MFLAKIVRPLWLFLRILGCTFAVLFLFRVVFALSLLPVVNDLSPSTLLQAFWVGARFDLRLAAILCLPVGLFCLFAYSYWPRTVFFRIFYFLVGFFIFSLYALDYGFYSYLGVRLNATLFDLLADLSASYSMVWQSYPIVWISLGIFLASYLYMKLLVFVTTRPRTDSHSWAARCGGAFFALFILTFCLHGNPSINFFPLRWSHAYFHPNLQVVALGLNPAQNLYDTYASAGQTSYSLEKVKDAYPRMCKFLGVTKPDLESLSYAREERPDSLKQKNIVIIIMESLAYPKSSFAPGGENTTPYLQRLAKESLLFHRFFANTRTTARAVFTVLTGIPDLNVTSTASRNPLASNQYLILNEFKGYDTFYMLGGDTSWANIRAVLGSNVEGLNILEGSFWEAAPVDVWGISDYALFMEAHKVLNERPKDKPFVALIQTASFHKPYTIPDTPGFVKEELSEEKLALYGFDSQEEYNSLRFSDFALGAFMEEAKKSEYYKDTIFFIFGDHGLKDHGKNMPAGYTAGSLAPWHVPLLIHGDPQQNHIPIGESTMLASHVDIFATAAGLAGISFENRTMGRDLFDSYFDGSRAVFIGGAADTPIRLIMDDYVLYDNLVGHYSLFGYNEGSAEDLSQEEPEVFTFMKRLSEDIKQTAQYMLLHNPRTKKNRPE